MARKSCSEKNARAMVDDHVAMVGAVMEEAFVAVDHYLRDNLEAAKESARRVDNLENQADTLLREFMTCLKAGAFIPLLRKDLMRVISAVDKVANAAESTCDFCLAQRPDIPAGLREPFRAIMRANSAMFPELKAVVEVLKLGTFGLAGDPDREFAEAARRVGVAESDIDDMEWKLTREIFGSELPLANKMHLHALLNHVTRMSDLIEDVADRVQMMITQEAL